MQGAQSYRSKRDLMGRLNSTDENQFIRKAQEMVHCSFQNTEPDELSKSYISTKQADRMSVSVLSGTKRKDEDPVIIDWCNAMSKEGGTYANKTQHRAQASLHEADDFLSKQVSQLDAVSEVDSQVGATPMNMCANEKLTNRTGFGVQPSTPRENANNPQFEPSQFMGRNRSQMMTSQPNRGKASDLNQ